MILRLLVDVKNFEAGRTTLSHLPSLHYCVLFTWYSSR